MDDLRGRVAVVTGAAGGLGRAMAERFAAQGMRVVVADVDESGARCIDADRNRLGEPPRGDPGRR